MKKILSLLLVLVMLLGSLTGCGATKYTPPEVSQLPAERRTVKFDEMKYERYEVETLIKLLEEATEAVKAEAIDFDTLVKYNEAIVSEAIQESSMSTLSYVRFDMDHSDEFYETEMNYYLEKGPEISAKYVEYDQVCLASKYADQLEEHYGDFFLFSEDNNLIPYDKDELAEVQKKINDLSMESQNQIGDLSHDFEDGKGEVNVLEAMNNATSQEDYTMYYDYYARTLNAENGQRYVDLLKLRRQAAAIEGYDNYNDYYYSEDSGTTESSKKTAQLLIDKFKYGFNLPYPDFAEQMSSEDLVKNLGQVSAKFSDKSKACYDYMMANDLMSTGENDVVNCYSTHIDSYDAPVLMLTAGGSGQTLSTAIHEFGHFMDAYHNYDSARVGYMKDINVAEVSSQALELLATHYYEEIYGDDADNAEAALHYGAITGNFGFQALLTKFELLANEMEDPTVEKLNDLYVSILVEIYGDMVKDYELYCLSWTQVPHIFISPLYNFDYCTSMNVAYQIYFMSLEDLDKAREVYFSFVKDQTTEDILVRCERSGLKSPFDPETWDQLDEFFTNYFLED